MIGAGRPEPAGPPSPTAQQRAEHRAEERARRRAEGAEFDALLARLRAHQPNYRCFCGSLDDLRRVVADLDRRAARDQPRSRRATPGPAARPTALADARVGDPQLTARLAVARAAQHAGHDEAADQADRQAQLSHWHTHDHSHDEVGRDGVQDTAAITRGEDGDG